MLRNCVCEIEIRVNVCVCARVNSKPTKVYSHSTSIQHSMDKNKNVEFFFAHKYDGEKMEIHALSKEIFRSIFCLCVFPGCGNKIEFSFFCSFFSELS